uniref:Single-stranded DNA-binding protein, mitochondrial n=1 Tax=Lygus hesperus TaxID=30085 RepID=A0A0A9W7H0_LYGHE
MFASRVLRTRSWTRGSVLPPSVENLPPSAGPQPQSPRPFPQGTRPHPHFAVPNRNATSQPVKIPPNMVLERTLNQVTLLGRVGGDPIKKGSIEHPMVEFSIATHSSYKNEEGEQTQKTDWHRICVFKPSLRDLVFTYLKKGQRVYITGKIVYSSTKQDNVTQNRVSIFADQIVFFQGSPDDENYNN